MLFPRLIVPVLTMLFTGCADAVAPPMRVTGLYVLESVGGQPLPTTFTRNTGETATVFWATVNLDVTGNATIVERRRTQTTAFQHERTDARITDYEIVGETISIGPPCPLDPTIDCYPKRFGQITHSTLALSGDLGDPQGLVFLYRLAATAD